MDTLLDFVGTNVDTYVHNKMAEAVSGLVVFGVVGVALAVVIAAVVMVNNRR